MGNDDAQKNLDSGYAWAVLAAGAIAVATSTSMNATFGLLFGKFLKDMQADPQSMAIVLGISSAIYSVGMFFSGPLSKILPIRATCVTSALFMTSSLVLVSRTSALWEFILAFSFAYSLASGTLFGSSFLLVNQYFDKRRGMAMGIFFGGSSIGRMILPILVASLVPYCGITKSILIIAGIWGITIPAAWLHHPRVNPSSNNQREQIQGCTTEGVKCDSEATVGVDRFHQPTRKFFGEITLQPNDKQSSSAYIVNEIEEDKDKTGAGKRVGNGREIATISSEVSTKSTYTVSGIIYDGPNAGIEDEPTPRSCFQRLPEPVKRFIFLPRDVFRQLDFDLFSSPIAVLIIFSECCSWTAINHISYMTAVELREREFDESAIGTFLVVPPVLDLVSRLTVPLLHDRQWVHPKFAYSFGLLLMAVSAAAFPFTSTSWWLIVTCCALFGFGQGCAVSYFGLVAVHYHGMKRLASMRAFTGILPAVFIMAFGAVIGATKSATSSYDIGFISISAFTAAPVFLWWFLEPKLARSAASFSPVQPTKR